MKNRYFIIGGSYLQLSFIEAVQAEGFETFVFDLDQNCPGKKKADHFINISIYEKEEILKVGEIDPDKIHTPGIYVNRIIKGKNYSRAIENLTVREK